MNTEDDRMHLSPDGVSARKAATVKGHSLARRLMATPARRRANAEVDWDAWIADIEDEARRAPSAAPAPASAEPTTVEGRGLLGWLYRSLIYPKDRDAARDSILAVEREAIAAAVRDAHALREKWTERRAHLDDDPNWHGYGVAAVLIDELLRDLGAGAPAVLHDRSTGVPSANGAPVHPGATDGADPVAATTDRDVVLGRDRHGVDRSGAQEIAVRDAHALREPAAEPPDAWGNEPAVYAKLRHAEPAAGEREP